MESDNLQLALEESSIICPPFDKDLLKKWFPHKANVASSSKIDDK
jgi:hypothetical protein